MTASVAEARRPYAMGSRYFFVTSLITAGSCRDVVAMSS
jgi:hypothetical protein